MTQIFEEKKLNVLFCCNLNTNTVDAYKTHLYNIQSFIRLRVTWNDLEVQSIQVH